MGNTTCGKAAQDVHNRPHLSYNHLHSALDEQHLHASTPVPLTLEHPNIHRAGKGIHTHPSAQLVDSEHGHDGGNHEDDASDD